MQLSFLIVGAWISSLAGYGIYKAFSKPSKSNFQYRSVRRLEVLNKRANKRLNDEVR